MVVGGRQSITSGRTLTLARPDLDLELALEAKRWGLGFPDSVRGLPAAVGCPEPVGGAACLVAWSDGILFNAAAGSGAGRAAGQAALREQVELMLRSLLG